MIEPFAPEQVRMSDGHKIVSYGTSSYGYDVRCTDDFKIFTNINSTIVDPKSFDEKSFVDFKGPVCIIPPNSFALASTVEFFRIPRNVLVACLGKIGGVGGVCVWGLCWGECVLVWGGLCLRGGRVSVWKGAKYIDAEAAALGGDVGEVDIVAGAQSVSADSGS